ncbi:hypothetical protein RVV18_004695 [Burkholderia ambifaria]|nr:hypothetical protein [Burkholderia ambifaria]
MLALECGAMRVEGSQRHVAGKRIGPRAGRTPDEQKNGSPSEQADTVAGHRTQLSSHDIEYLNRKSERTAGMRITDADTKARTASPRSGEISPALGNGAEPEKHLANAAPILGDDP